MTLYFSIELGSLEAFFGEIPSFRWSFGASGGTKAKLLP